MTERRWKQRYDLTLPINLRLPAQVDGSASLGRTRNLSTSGILFTVDRRLAQGSSVDLTVTLSVDDAGESRALIHVRGTVIRVEERLETVDVAAVIEKYEIIRKESE